MHIILTIAKSCDNHMTTHHKARSLQFQQVVNINNTNHVSLIVSCNLGQKELEEY